MSSKSTKKLPQPDIIVTRFKSSQKIQLRKMDRSMKQMTQLLKSPTRSPRKKSGKPSSKDNNPKDIKNNVVKEFLPNKLKRNLCAKKVVLKPKYNSVVVAATNKRKLATPHKGICSPERSPNTKQSVEPLKSYDSPRRPSPEISMTESIRLMEETRSLSDEDFLEILTCPSPVWWEEPPDEGYVEDPICSLPDLSESKLNLKKPVTKNISNNMSKPNTDSSNTQNDLIDFEREIDQFRLITKKCTKNDKFERKKSKLENVLGNIKKRVNMRSDKEIESNDNVANVKNRRLSSSTEGEDLYSDMSFNEEEILRDLESIEIPMEDSKPDKCEDQTEQNSSLYIKVRNDLLLKPEKKDNDLTIVPTKLPPLKRKPALKEIKKPVKFIKLKSIIKMTESDSISGSNMRFISDDDSQNSDEISDNTKKSSDFSDDKNLSKNVDSLVNPDISDVNDKLNCDLSEYVTVYKIISDGNNENEANANDTGNQMSVTGKHASQINNFYKKCKNNKRFKKSNGLQSNAANKTNGGIKISDKRIELNNDQNRNGCDYCIIRPQIGTKDFSCEKCKETAIVADLGNLQANAKEATQKHVSRCKDQDRMSWSHSYVLNQT